MKRFAALGWLLALVLVVAGWTTQKSSGTKHAFAYYTTAIGIIGGDRDSIPKGATFISIVENSLSATTGANKIYISSPDVKGDTTSFIIATGGGYEGNFPHGIDSLSITTLVTGNAFSVEVTN